MEKNPTKEKLEPVRRVLRLVRQNPWMAKPNTRTRIANRPPREVSLKHRGQDNLEIFCKSLRKHNLRQKLKRKVKKVKTNSDAPSPTSPQLPQIYHRLSWSSTWQPRRPVSAIQQKEQPIEKVPTREKLELVRLA